MRRVWVRARVDRRSAESLASATLEADDHPGAQLAGRFRVLRRHQLAVVGEITVVELSCGLLPLLKLTLFVRVRRSTVVVAPLVTRPARLRTAATTTLRFQRTCSLLLTVLLPAVTLWSTP